MLVPWAHLRKKGGRARTANEINEPSPRKAGEAPLERSALGVLARDVLLELGPRRGAQES